MTMVLTLSDVAEELRLSRRSVDRLAAAGRLPTVLVGGGAVRVRRQDLDRFVSALEVRAMHADAEHRAEFATAGRQEMTQAERNRIDGIVAEMTEASEHRGDQGPVVVLWQRDGIEEPLERRFASRAEADRFAARLSANPEPGKMVRLDIDDGVTSAGPAVDPVALRRAQLDRKRR